MTVMSASARTNHPRALIAITPIAAPQCITVYPPAWQINDVDAANNVTQALR
jgi:hypothetical protein